MRYHLMSAAELVDELVIEADQYQNVWIINKQSPELHNTLLRLKSIITAIENGSMK